jgi:hypothetical protein
MERVLVGVTDGTNGEPIGDHVAEVRDSVVAGLGSRTIPTMAPAHGPLTP